MRKLLPHTLLISFLIVLVGVLWLLTRRDSSDFMVILAFVVLLTLSVSALLDLYALASGKETIGDGISRTTRRFGLYRSILSIFLGALLGHFFWPSP